MAHSFTVFPLLYLKWYVKSSDQHRSITNLSSLLRQLFAWKLHWLEGSMVHMTMIQASLENQFCCIRISTLKDAAARIFASMVDSSIGFDRTDQTRYSGGQSSIQNILCISYTWIPNNPTICQAALGETEKALWPAGLSTSHQLAFSAFSNKVMS